MDLKELLGDELAGQVTEKLGDKKLILDTGNMVDTKSEDFPKKWMPRSVYNADRTALKEQLEERTRDLDLLKEQSKGGEALKTRIVELEEKYKAGDEAAKKALEVQVRKHAVHLVLVKDGCNAPELIAPLVDTEKLVKLSEGNYSGIDDLVKPLKEQYASNFTSVVPNGAPPASPPSSTDSPEKHDLAVLRQKLGQARDKGDTLAAVRLERMVAEHKGN